MHEKDGGINRRDFLKLVSFGLAALAESCSRRTVTEHPLHPGVATTLLTTPPTEGPTTSLKENEPTSGQWDFASIDTMKQSRDQARILLAKINTDAEALIGQELENIKELAPHTSQLVHLTMKNFFQYSKLM